MSSMDELVLLEPAEMAVADRLTIEAGVPGTTLMENAGYAVADDISVRHGQGTRVAVVCGPGNNGGDGFVVARVLAERGFVVRLGLLGDRGTLTGDAAIAADRFRGPVEPATPALLQRADVVVDALFGAGLARPLEGAAADMVRAINAAGASGVIVVAVDLPSGIDGRTGAVQGVAVKARRSVTFFRRKPGHLLLPGRLHAGRITVADIGIRPSVLRAIGSRCHANEPALWRDLWPGPQADAHKYSRGAALVVSGPVHACGAARLASAAALQAGAGLVTVACPVDAVAVVAAYRAALVVKPVSGAGDVAALAREPRVRAIVCGPGLGTGPEEAAIVAAVLAAPAAVVLDADAITLAAADPALREAIRARSAPTVMTPHEGEYARLFPGAAGSKLERARDAAAELGVVCVLKGPDTVIAAPDGRAAINANAPAQLATAGSGDVLAGIIAAMLAQSVPPFEAAAMAVHTHGRAGGLAGPGLVADDLVPAVGRVVGEGPGAD
jgi:hydroxyethylthiazole kinase-like uncharacterized protein yjeF